MGLSWQQGPLSPGAIGRFLLPEPLPKRLLYAEPLRRRMRVRFGGIWIADSEEVLLLFEPGHYPMAYFREADVSAGTLQRTGHTTRHPDLGRTSWYSVHASDKTAPRRAWQHIELPDHASELQGRRVRVARHGCLLRRRRAHPGSCRRQLSPYRYPAVVAPARRAPS